MKIVAIAPAGALYTYRIDTAHQVPAASCHRIRDALNAARHMLRPGEIWHLFDVDGYEADDVYKKYYIRSGKLWENYL